MTKFSEDFDEVLIGSHKAAFSAYARGTAYAEFFL